MSVNITWEPQLGGYSAWNGDKKVAVMGTSTQETGVVQNGVAVHKGLPPEQWGIHFTNPNVTVELLRAVLADLPTEAVPQERHRLKV